MPYPAISSRRMPYDVDGTEVGTSTLAGNSNMQLCFEQGIKSWLSSGSKQNLNKQTREEDFGGSSYPSVRAFWFFFPEIREITHMGFLFGTGSLPTGFKLQGSQDSVNGMDGIWEEAVHSFASGPQIDRWRTHIYTVSFAEPKKVIRFACNSGNYMIVNCVHLYGYKAAGETPDDLLFCDASTGAEKTSLMDWGDRPEGTTLIDSFKVKNASTGKIANNVNLQLNHDDFLMSWSADGPWTATLDIATLGVGALSNTVYVRNKLEPPLLILGPYAARVIASVGSWT